MNDFPLLYQDREDAPLRARRSSVPWAFIAPHEDQALRNHDQTLARLAERGGLSPREMLCVLERKPWREGRALTEAQALDRIEVLLEEWEGRP